MDAQKKLPSVGTCALCNSVVPKRSMTKHLETCVIEHDARERVQKKQPRDAALFHLLVEGRGMPEYWLHVEVRAIARLSALDQFLRGIWLECCGHLSQFKIGETYYISHNDPYEDAGDTFSQTRPLNKVIGPGSRFTHEYDFGTTTELTLRVLSERVGLNQRAAVRLLARNNPLDWRCAVCGKPATQVCSMCIYTESAAWYCDDVDCQAEHQCVDPGEYWLPVSNSPRVGMCGYTGFVDWGEEDNT